MSVTSQKSGASVLRDPVGPGGHTPLHKHPQEHEVFVLEGEGTFVFEGQQHPFGAEYVVFVPPNKEHRFMNTGDSVLRMLCIIPIN